MKTKTVLIMEAGGPCGVACAKLLRKSGEVKIVAVDMDRFAAGFNFADETCLVPSAGSPDFLPEISKILHYYSIDLIIPCFEYGIKKLSTLSGNFITDFGAAIKCKDKLSFSEICQAAGFLYPSTTRLDRVSEAILFPLYIKPRFGVGSRNNFLANNHCKFTAILKLVDEPADYIAQEYLSGKHWNVDVLVISGKYITAVPREDIVQKSGNCITVSIVNYRKLIDFARKVQKLLKINSPFNLEVFEVRPGEFIINEINVRFGGGVIFSALAGVDMVSYLVSHDPKYLGTIKEGVYTRYYEETLVNTKNITKIS